MSQFRGNQNRTVLYLVDMCVGQSVSFSSQFFCVFSFFEEFEFIIFVVQFLSFACW